MVKKKKSSCGGLKTKGKNGLTFGQCTFKVAAAVGQK
jgi:hypothetical protein